jgi:predicted nucleotide-binding protein (sugar kinase/HSP70/actin superfamily)
VEIDAEYAAQTRELAQKRNSDIESLTKNVHDLEEELARTEQIKTSFLNPFAKKAKTQKMAEVTQKLNAAKKELEMAVQSFGVEQEKFHDEYEKKKQATIEKVQSLEKEIVNIETDSSLETRQTATNALANAVKALLQRKTVPSQ